MLAFLHLLAEKIPCSVELSMKVFFITSEPGFLYLKLCGYTSLFFCHYDNGEQLELTDMDILYLKGRFLEF